MSWLYERKLFHSPRNGVIIVERMLGKWRIIVDGISQTSPYVTKMWAGALGRLSTEFTPQNVLVLGLGGGGVIKALLERFSFARITAVEWDSVMVELAQKINLFPQSENINIICADADAFVRESEKVYDLILFDLFTGSVMTDHTSQELFFKNLSQRLSDGGFLIVNFFQQKENDEKVRKLFDWCNSWEYYYNTLCLYTKRSL